MKKTLCIVLITAMLLSVMPMVVFADTPEGTAITSASQLLGMSKTDTGNYYLANDITISGYWTGENFYGNLDGNGHTIYIENGATIKNGIFNGLWGSYVKNLNIVQLGTARYQARSSAVGVLTRGVNNNDVTISNVYIKADMSNVLTDTDAGFTGSNASNVAAFVGQILANNEGPKEGMSLVMENCVFEGKIVKSSADTGRATAAMVAGTSVSDPYTASLTIRNCINYGDITSGSPAGSMLGRPIGSDDGQGSGLSSITITGCINYGDITVTGTGDHASAGGILGKVEQEANATLTVTNNINYGNVSAPENAGGIGGAIRWHNNSTLTSNGNVNYGTMSATNFGAIMGLLWQRNDTSDGVYSKLYNYCNAIQQEEAHNGDLIDADTMTNLASLEGAADLYTTLPNGKITLSWAKEAGYTDQLPGDTDAILVGAQLSGNATDESRDVRLVCGLDKTEGLTDVGVLIIATYANGESRKMFEGKTAEVYQSILAGGEEVYATQYNKDYFYTAVVYDIPTSVGAVTFEVRTFELATNGTVVYSNAQTVNVNMAA